MTHTKQYQKFLLAVGEFIIEYSKAEINCALLVNLMTQSDRGIDIYRTSPNAEQKLLEYRKAIRGVEHPSKNAFAEMLERLDVCRVDRNLIAHSVWRNTISFESKDFHSIRYNRNGKTFDYKKLTTFQSEELSQKMKKLSEDILLEITEIVILKKGEIHKG